jgi:hypothetical protein
MSDEQKETWGGVLIVVLVLGVGLATGNKGCGSSSPPAPAPQYRPVFVPGGPVPYSGGGAVDLREQERIRQYHENRIRQTQEEQRRWEQQRREQDAKFRGNPYMR